MAESTVPLAASTVLLMILFFLSVVGVSAGNFLLYLMLKARGIDIPFVMSGLLLYPSIIYFRQRPQIQSRVLDVLALLVIICAPVVIVTALFLFPEMTGRSS
jgi:hypothetical protein